MRNLRKYDSLLLETKYHTIQIIFIFDAVYCKAKLIGSMDYESEILITLVITKPQRASGAKRETVPALHYIKRDIGRERNRKGEEEV